ncbi:DUF6328 family protein [Rhodococcus qingshengii]|uniref:DUF6328 family protein n=2 Tax=Bacillati TaxID=1783272 RepID=UPI000AB705BE|nr:MULTISPECIES: DUF6328 family protein [Rhodococcus]MCQ4148864.1 DUF6328 family protein [Rhodococcus qingshengii]MCT6732876.1 DUF6328 family protein [Rhodococcus qingshengii]MDJ0433154.1 DUF6328 family protein [Rhodococcus qingshengii]WNF41901.1 DUF6328 family protein [Rhodococcus sp. SG20037]
MSTGHAPTGDGARPQRPRPEPRPEATAPPRADSEWNYRVRHETPTQRLDRNWSHILQELRVVQTGMQILTGFLLTLPFQQRFSDLQAFEKDLYLITLAMSTAATIVLVSPVAMHRLLFRRHALPVLVEQGQRFAVTGLLLLGGALTGVLTLTFDVVVNKSTGLIAGGCAVLLAITLWCCYPLLFAHQLHLGRPEKQPDEPQHPRNHH